MSDLFCIFFSANVPVQTSLSSRVLKFMDDAESSFDEDDDSTLPGLVEAKHKFPTNLRDLGHIDNLSGKKKVDDDDDDYGEEEGGEEDEESEDENTTVEELPKVIIKLMFL